MAGLGRRQFSAIAHPEVRAPDPTDPVVTYATDSFDFEDSFTEQGSEHLYGPRVITVNAISGR